MAVIPPTHAMMLMRILLLAVALLVLLVPAVQA